MSSQLKIPWKGRTSPRELLRRVTGSFWNRFVSLFCFDKCQTSYNLHIREDLLWRLFYHSIRVQNCWPKGQHHEIQVVPCQAVDIAHRTREEKETSSQSKATAEHHHFHPRGSETSYQTRSAALSTRMESRGWAPLARGAGLVNNFEPRPDHVVSKGKDHHPGGTRSSLGGGLCRALEKKKCQ